MPQKEIVVEVGFGHWPWVFQHKLVTLDPKNKRPIKTSIMDQYASCESSRQFVCFDLHQESLCETLQSLTEIKKLDPNFNENKVALCLANGNSLPLKDKAADVFIISDVLSAPNPKSRYAEEDPEICVGELTKRKIIHEGIRILKNGGVFVISICQTPCYAANIFKWFSNQFVAKKLVTLVKQHGQFVQNSDDWHVYHAVFQKNPGPFTGTAELIPWTKKQKEAIEREKYRFFGFY